MSSQPVKSPAGAAPVNIVTQTRVLPRYADEFTRWQNNLDAVISGVPGYIGHQVLPPNPPTQIDWVIVQQFANIDAARSWLNSPARQNLVAEITPMLVGPDDIHVIPAAEAAPRSSVSAVISVRIKPGHEDDLRGWSQRISAAEAHFPGYQGQRLDPPIAGVQDDWTTVVRFDTEEHLNAWMTSPERQKFLTEAAPFIADTHYRTVRSGFEQWFQTAAVGGAPPPVWKQNMLTLLALYPVVFLFGYFVSTPLLINALHLPFYLALFIGNVAGVLILTLLVPWLVHRFDWWLNPASVDPRSSTIRGTVLIAVLYVVLLLIFSRF